jgi:hypothetical protein
MIVCLNLISLALVPVPVIQLPHEMRAVPGRMVRITAETVGKQVMWHLVGEEADLVPFPAGKVALFSSPKPGRYTVLAWTALADVPSAAAVCTVIVGDPPAPPADSWVQEFRKLIRDDTSAEKAQHLAQLAVLYREAGRFTETAEASTVGDLAARIRAAAASLLPADSLVALRKRIADEIAKQLPLDGEQPLDAVTRAKAAKLFIRIAQALEDCS